MKKLLLLTTLFLAFACSKEESGDNVEAQNDPFPGRWRYYDSQYGNRDYNIRNDKTWQYEDSIGKWEVTNSTLKREMVYKLYFNGKLDQTWTVQYSEDYLEAIGTSKWDGSNDTIYNLEKIF